MLDIQPTPYGNIPLYLFKKYHKIKLLICDVDGVLSNGLIFIGNNNEEFKSFHVHDGYGIRCLLSANIEVAIITGRCSKIVENRANELGIKYCYQGVANKLEAFDSLLQKINVQYDEIAYIGDDLIDLPVMLKIGLSIAVKNAHPLLIPHVDYVTQNKGGLGAVREVCDLILFCKGKQQALTSGLSI